MTFPSDFDQYITSLGMDLARTIFIPGEVPSSKNSQRILIKNVKPGQSSYWTFKGKRVTPFIAKDEFAMAYQEAAIWYYKATRTKFLKMVDGLEKPYRIGFAFIRKYPNKQWDFLNICQLVQDLMQAALWITGDNVQNILPFPVVDSNGNFPVGEHHGVAIVALRNFHNKDILRLENTLDLIVP